jgi:methyl-accepting chemotaxis protein
VEEVAQGNAAASEELAGTAEELSAQAEAMYALMGFFHTEGGARSRLADRSGPRPRGEARPRSSARPSRPTARPRPAASAQGGAGHIGEEDAGFERFQDLKGA